MSTKTSAKTITHATFRCEHLDRPGVSEQVR